MNVEIQEYETHAEICRVRGHQLKEWDAIERDICLCCGRTFAQVTDGHGALPFSEDE